MSVALESEKEDIYQISEDDELLDATRIQMVLGSLEKSLVDVIYKDVHNFDIKSGAGNKAYKSFVLPLFSPLTLIPRPKLVQIFFLNSFSQEVLLALVILKV